MEKEITKKYHKEGFSIIWKPSLCIHAAECVKALPRVYSPSSKPWIKQENASVSELKAQIAKCPSGALSWEENMENVAKTNDPTQVNVIPNGPLMVKGALHFTDKAGNQQMKDGVSAFCRCGASGNKPFCDGSHKKIEFKDE